MPGGPDQIEAAIAAEDSKTAEARRGGVAGAIPTAKEPLEESNLNALGSALQAAVPVLSQGQVPELQLGEVAGPSDSVPQDIGTALLTVAAFVDTAKGKVPGLERYAFDPVGAMETNAGLQSATRAVIAMSEDQALLSKLSAGAPRQAPPGEEEAEGELAGPENTEEE